MPKSVSASDYLSRAIELSNKTQREIALAAGYDKPNVLSMMKTGVTKIPLGKAPVLAKACGVDPKVMLRVVMMDYYPDVWEVLAEPFETEMLTDEERKLIRKHRTGRFAAFMGKFRSTRGVPKSTS